MFDHFSPYAVRLIDASQQEAERLRHSLLGAEHFLLGLLQDRGSLPFLALDIAGRSVEQVRMAVEERMVPGDQLMRAPLPFTKQALRICERAVTEATRFGQFYVETDHVFLGLLEESDGIAIQALTCLGIDVVSVRRVVAAYIMERVYPLSHPGTRRIEHSAHIPAARTDDLVPLPNPPDAEPWAPPPSLRLIFDHLSVRSRVILTVAHQEAERCRHAYIGTEHILMGLMNNLSKVAKTALNNLDIDIGQFHHAVLTSLVIGTTTPPPNPIPFTPGAVRTVQRAGDEARGLGKDQVDDVHLWLGMLAEPDHVLAWLLATKGVTPEQGHDVIIDLLAPYPPAELCAELVERESNTLHPQQTAPQRMASMTWLSQPFDNFTERACKILALSQKVARQYRQDYIGTEHLLLGLVQEGGGVAVTAFNNLNVDVEKVRLEVEKLVVSSDKAAPSGPPPFTHHAKRVLELASEEARALGHPYIGSEHLLLGMLDEPQGVAYQVLTSCGSSIDEIRKEILNCLGWNS